MVETPLIFSLKQKRATNLVALFWMNAELKNCLTSVVNYYPPFAVRVVRAVGGIFVAGAVRIVDAVG